MLSQSRNRTLVPLLGTLLLVAGAGLVWQQWLISGLKMVATQTEVERTAWINERSELETRLKTAEKRTAETDDTSAGARTRSIPDRTNDGNRKAGKRGGLAARDPAGGANPRMTKAGRNQNGPRQLTPAGAAPRAQNDAVSNNLGLSEDQVGELQEVLTELNTTQINDQVVERMQEFLSPEQIDLLVAQARAGANGAQNPR
jgi:hypothetical protein